jgi:hypothetical protein
VKSLPEILAGFWFGATTTIIAQSRFPRMGYEQYINGFKIGFMGYRPHGKDWMPAELYPSFFGSTLIVKIDTNGKEGCHEKRFDRLSLYCFTIGDTPGDNVDHRRSRTPPRSENP